MSAKFDEFPSLPFQDIKEKPKCHDRCENSIPPTNIVCGGGIIMYYVKNKKPEDQRSCNAYLIPGPGREGDFDFFFSQFQ